MLPFLHYYLEYNFPKEVPKPLKIPYGIAAMAYPTLPITAIVETELSGPYDPKFYTPGPLWRFYLTLPLDSIAIGLILYFVRRAWNHKTAATHRAN